MLVYMKQRCNVTFLDIVKEIIKKIHFFGLMELYEQVAKHSIKYDQQKSEIQELRELVLAQAEELKIMKAQQTKIMENYEPAFSES